MRVNLDQYAGLMGVPSGWGRSTLIAFDGKREAARCQWKLTVPQVAAFLDAALSTKAGKAPATPSAADAEPAAVVDIVGPRDTD
jgi:hypothetical protein